MCAVPTVGHGARVDPYVSVHGINLTVDDVGLSFTTIAHARSAIILRFVHKCDGVHRTSHEY